MVLDKNGVFVKVGGTVKDDWFNSGKRIHVVTEDNIRIWENDIDKMNSPGESIEVIQIKKKSRKWHDKYSTTL